MKKSLKAVAVLGLALLFLVGVVGAALAAGEETTPSATPDQSAPAPAGGDASPGQGAAAPTKHQAQEHERNKGNEFRLRLEERLRAEVEEEEEKEVEEGHEGLANRIAKLEAELAKSPGDTNLLWKLAVAYRAAGEYDKAIGVLKELEKLSPQGAKVAVMLALCLRAKGDSEAALTELEELGATVPGTVYAYRAILREELGDLDKAAEEMEGAVSGSPAEKELYEKLGELYEKAGKGEDVKVFLKGKKVAFDVQPMIVQNRTMVPVRAIAEALGAEVKWDGETRTVIVLKAGKVVLIPIGSLKARVDGTQVALDVPAMIVGNRTLIPLRFVSESLGALVDWFGTGQVVAIN
ncbi:MAG: stalk domain-containing protein [Bacillota bacterium]|nr:stalk domain-containing protein [Bacillota bacterium]